MFIKLSKTQYVNTAEITHILSQQVRHDSLLVTIHMTNGRHLTAKLDNIPFMNLLTLLEMRVIQDDDPPTELDLPPLNYTPPTDT